MECRCKIRSVEPADRGSIGLKAPRCLHRQQTPRWVQEVRSASQSIAGFRLADPGLRDRHSIEPERFGTSGDLIGVDVLEDLIFTWLRPRVTGAASRPVSSEVLGEIADRMINYEVVLSLFRGQLPESLQVGPVLLRTISVNDFDRCEVGAVDTADPSWLAGLDR